jgi:integrase
MLVEVRALCGWALKRDLIEKDPTRAIERATQPDKLKAQFTVAELVHLLALPTPDPAWRKRFALMLYAGLRDDEAAALTWSDVDVSGRVIKIRKHVGHRLKRGKERIVELQRELAQILGESGSGKVAPVIDQHNARRGCDGFLADCGIPKAGRSPHSCRHTYAALMTATGVAGFMLADLMGHSSQATTAGYARLARQHSRAVEGWQRGEFSLLDSAGL